MSPIIFICTIFATFIALTSGATAEQWRHKVIYQLMTDRFATSDGSKPFCNVELNDYCGGTFTGIAKKVGYLKELGVDAVWISPTPDNFPQGYHGYWAKSLYETNPYFGSAAELKKMVKVLHENDIWVMGDVVANHMGYSDSYDNISLFDPFNETQYYHTCEFCDPENCWVFDYQNESQLLYCRLFGLPDLNQSVPYVNETLLNWIADLIKNYSFDGVRIDTLPYVAKDFWGNFSQRGGVYTIGEVADGRIDWVSSFQGYVDGLLNFPMYYTLNNVFKQGWSMTNISSTWRRSIGSDYYQNCPDTPDGNDTNGNDTDDNGTTPNPYTWGAELFNLDELNAGPNRRLLQSSGGSGGYYGNGSDLSYAGSGYFKDIGVCGNFIENHDFGRYLDGWPYYNSYRNVLSWVICAEGIPILYYGSEQGYNGGHNPYCREALWDSGYQTDNAWQGFFKFIQRLLVFRKETKFYLFPHNELYAGDNMYVFARGQVVIALTNLYLPGKTKTWALVNRLPWPVGTKVCDILSNGTQPSSQCYLVDKTGYLNITMDGEPRIFSPNMWPWLGEAETFMVTETIFIILAGIFVIFVLVVIHRVYRMLHPGKHKELRTAGFVRLNRDTSSGYY